MSFRSMKINPPSRAIVRLGFVLLSAGLSLGACTEPQPPATPHGPVVAAGAAALEEDAAPDSVATPAGIVDWLRKRHAGMRVEVHGSQRGAGAPFAGTFYDAEAGEDGEDYTSGMLLWSGGGTPVADVKLGGDSPPRSVRWLDFDGDGRRDLFVLWGGEDQSGGGVFLNRAAGRFSDSAFVRVWQTDSELASVLDLDGDGRPEIAQPDAWTGEQDEWPCGDVEVPASIRTDAAREDRRLSSTIGGPASTDTTDSTDAEDGPTVMALWMPVRILAIRGSRAVDVTREHAQHVGWRLEMLARMRAAPGVSRECSAELARVARVMRERAGIPADTLPET